MKILFIGDIVSKSGRSALFKYLPKLKRDYKIDFTIANGENAAHGKGITEKIFRSIIDCGVDMVTLGNHAYSKSEIFDFIDDEQLIRPINLNSEMLGAGYRLVKIKDKTIMIANVMGEVFMNKVTESPFIASKKLVDVKADIKIIDFHAEATAEKAAYIHMFKDEFTAVVGTHTHIQTADADIFNGCAFISDVGMCGPYDSIIGRDTTEVLDRFLNKNSDTYYTVSLNEAVLNAIVIEIDDISSRAINIETIRILPKNN